MIIGLNALFLAPGKGGGMERHLRNMVKAMSLQTPEHEFILFTNKENTGSFEGLFQEKTIPASALFRPSKILWEQAALPIQAKNAGCDVLISFGNICPIINGPPSILVIHDLIPFEWSGEFGPVEGVTARTLFRKSAASADLIVTPSNFIKDEAVRKFDAPSEKIRVIPGACDDAFSPPPPARIAGIKDKWAGGNDFVLTAASARAHKNLKTLLEAFQILKGAHMEDLRLIVAQTAGTGEQIRKMAADMNLAGCVRTAESIRDQDLADLYGAASAFVYPSLYEGFGLPVLEAMACGTAVASSNAASLPEVAGDAALLFDPLDAEGMARSIMELLINSDLKDSMVEKSLKRVKSFSWNDSALKMALLAGELAGRSS